MDLQRVIEQTVNGMGYDLVDLEFSGRGLLRVTIDLPYKGAELNSSKSSSLGQEPGAKQPWEGEFVSVEDCEKVTRQLNYLLTVENVEYARLEVSSPGLDRPLRKPEDFVRFAGEEVKLKLRLPLAGRRNFVGLLQVLGHNDFALEFDPRACAARTDSRSQGPGKTKSAQKRLSLMSAPQKSAPQKTSTDSGDKNCESGSSGPSVHQLRFVFEDVEKANLVPQIVFNRSPAAPKYATKQSVKS